MPATHTKVIEYIADHRQVLQAISQIERANLRMAKGLGANFGSVAKVIGKDVQQISKTRLINPKTAQESVKGVEKFSQAVQLSSGRVGNLTTTTSKLNGVVSSTKTSFTDTSAKTVSLGQNIGRLAARAALTIPIWFALRTAVMGTFRTIKDGLQTLVDQDRALQKARRNLSATAKTQEELTSQVAKLSTETQKLSLESGISVEKVTKAFQRFATVGFDYEVAMAGAQGATKLAVLLFGDAEETANAFARSMRTLIDTSASSEEQARQLSEAMALTDQLWKTNAFTIKEFTNNLEKFGGRAKAANLSIRETITLLATLSTAGLRNRAGRLLGTTLLKALQRFSEVAQVLRLDVNPAVDTTFDYMMKLVDALEEIGKTQKIPAELASVLGDLFNIRTTEVLLALKAMRTVLKDNIAVLPDLKRFDAEYKVQTEHINRQVDRYHNLNKEIGKTFVEGLVDADNFDTALAKINASLRDMLNGAKSVGTVLGAVLFAGPRVGTAIGENIAAFLEGDKIADKISPAIAQNMHDAIVYAMRGLLKEKELTQLLNNLLKVQTLNLDIGLDEGTLTRSISVVREQLVSLSKENADALTEQEKKAKKLANTESQILRTVITKQEYLQLENQLKEELRANGLEELEAEQAILAIRERTSSFVSKELLLQRQLVEHLKTMERIELSRARAKGLIENQLAELRLRGATNMQLLQAQHAMERMYGINQDRMSLLQNELSLQREITKERLNQNELSGESIKLFEIAQKFGTGVAFDITKFLQGTAPVSAFEVGGKFSNLMSILEQYFKSELTQRKAMEFFFKGAGQGIPIDERTAIRDFQPLPLTALQLPEIKTNIESIKVEIKQALEKGQISEYIIEELANAIRTNGIVQQAIDEQIEDY